jgi:hypothetical protein
MKIVQFLPSLNSGGAEKWEKNVKRRVYDALNVLYAADVLKKKDTK